MSQVRTEAAESPATRIRRATGRVVRDALPESWVQTTDAYRFQRSFRRAGVVFIHVPRTAGWSVNAVLYQRPPRHFTVDELSRVASADVLALPSFAIVRNPWDRAVSAFHFARQGGVAGAARIANPERYRGAEFEDFDGFVRHFLARNDPRHLDGVFRPQSDYVCRRDGTIPLRHVGVFDRLAETEAWLSATLGRAVELPALNGSARPTRDYRDFYTDHTAEIVGRVYRADVTRFGFAF